MPNEGALIEPLVETLTIPPAQGADEQKPNTQDNPAVGAEEQKTDDPEKQAERTESRRQRAARRDRDARVAAETEARLLREQLEKRDAPKASQADAEPKREDFEIYEDYQRALTRYEAKQVAREELKSDREATRGEQEKSKQSEAQNARAKAWTEREAAVIKATPDYEKEVPAYMEEDFGQLTKAAADFLIDSEEGPKLLHHLATHPDVHERIAKLSPLRQVVELGKLEESLPKPVEAKTSSTAPAPARPNPQGKSSASKDPEKMSQEEYAAWRKQQGARWAR